MAELKESIQVKVCGLTRADDVRLCAQLGVHRFGFVLAPSSRQLTLQQLDELLPCLPPGSEWVAVLVDAPATLIEALLERNCPRLQLHGQESPEECRRWRGRAAVTRALRVDSEQVLSQTDPFVDAADELLLDGARPGHGEAFAWEWLRQRPPLPFFLAGGLHPGNVQEAVRQARPWGVDVSSGVEQAPGIKCPERLRSFMERILDS